MSLDINCVSCTDTVHAMHGVSAGLFYDKFT